MKEVKRWIAVAVAVLPVGVIAERLTRLIPASDGGPDASMLVNDALGMGVLCTLAAAALALLTGVGAARLVSVRTGLFCGGAVLAWAAWGAGTVSGMIRTAQSGAPLRTLAVEGAIVAVLAALCAAAITHAGRRHEPRDEHDKLAAPSAAIAFACALVVGAAAGWLVAREDLKGQTIAAAGIAGLAGATAARIAAPRAHPAILVAAVALLGVAGPIAGLALTNGAVVDASYANTLFKLALPAPLDWAAGALMGVPLGMSWAASMMDRRTAQP